MKFPHLNLLCIIALLAFTSCSKEETATPESAQTVDSSIGMRCCDDDVSDLLENPKFHAFYSGFTTEVSDPAFGTLEQIDHEKLALELEAFEECIKSGNNFDSCLRQSEVLTRLFALISSYDLKQLQALIQEYDYLDKEEFNTVLIEAASQTLQDSERRLDCFMQFRVEVLEAVSASIIVALGSGVGGVVTIFAGVLRAKVNYCKCLYTNYGATC